MGEQNRHITFEDIQQSGEIRAYIEQADLALRTMGFTEHAFAHVTRLTGLMGRWQQLQASPRLICDTGHNTGGIQYIARQLQNESYHTLRIVIGM